MVRLIVLATAFTLGFGSAHAETLENVRQKGSVTCGVSVSVGLVALQSGEVDILSRITTLTFVRDTSIGQHMVMVNCRDGQGFLVRETVKAANLTELAGRGSNALWSKGGLMYPVPFR